MLGLAAEAPAVGVVAGVAFWDRVASTDEGSGAVGAVGRAQLVDLGELSGSAGGGVAAFAQASGGEAGFVDSQRLPGGDEAAFASGTDRNAVFGAAVPVDHFAQCEGGVVVASAHDSGSDDTVCGEGDIGFGGKLSGPECVTCTSNEPAYGT
ncbi:MAG: hypothetical protein JWN03_7420 [Nocardia sp.]|uniref:hypothetical protein n=1 Tax=Nocardia sp. TaxID=1821 RepID=UPI00260A49CA|nr:hypothetical protein [Nocardia sp.]MCU1647145.1 hypothetical protein [Nocardia sp.]